MIDAAHVILVVDDDEAIRDAVAEFLSDEGYAVRVAANGADALDQLRSGSPLPDLILLDLMMPVKDGFTFRTEQRADPRLSHIPVVVMSAAPSLEGRWQALDARSYVAKPFALTQLLEAVA